MKKVALLLALVLIAIPGSRVPAQKETALPPELKSNSSLTEILDWLNQHAFPYARVGVRAKGRTGTKSRFGIPRHDTPDIERFFSEGFQVKSINGCEVILSNEHPTIIDAHNRDTGHFRQFIRQKNGTQELTPQLALLFLRLDKMSDKRGKKPYVYSTDPQKIKLLGGYRTKFDQSGFFHRMIFEMELTATDQAKTKELGHFDYITFTFVDKNLAEQFNVAFRLAIKRCNSK